MDILRGHGGDKARQPLRPGAAAVCRGSKSLVPSPSVTLFQGAEIMEAFMVVIVRSNTR